MSFLDKAIGFSFSTKKPSSPSVIISRGPDGQSNDTQGTPQAIASINTIPKPSERDDITIIEAFKYFFCISATGL